jgi:hypothetical protein
MSRDEKPAVVYLRMSPQLRDGLRVAADDAGCSLNAFAVQVLAAAAGDPARFRDRAAEAARAAPRKLERDALGYPLEWAARWQHAGARNEFIAVMHSSDVPRSEWIPLVKKYDAEDPGFYVEWLRLRQDEHAARESEGRRGAA